MIIILTGKDGLAIQPEVFDIYTLMGRKKDLIDLIKTKFDYNETTLENVITLLITYFKGIVESGKVNTEDSNLGLLTHDNWFIHFSNGAILLEDLNNNSNEVLQIEIETDMKFSMREGMIRE